MKSFSVSIWSSVVISAHSQLVFFFKLQYYKASQRVYEIFFKYGTTLIL